MRFNDLEADAPKGAHLAVLQADGVARAIPLLAIMYLVEDPARPDKIQGVAFTDVLLNHGEHNRVELRFVCSCGKPGCTRKLALKGSWKGSHQAVFDNSPEKYARQILDK